MGYSEKSDGNLNSRFPKRIYWLGGAIGGAVILIFFTLYVLTREDAKATGAGPGQTRFTSHFEPEVQGAPRIEIPNDMVDYGDVHLGTTIQSEFSVRNVGDQPLIISGYPQVQIVEGCCAPPAIISSTVIEPGNQAKLSLEFMMHEGMGGQHEFRVHVRTNDPVEPDKQIVIRSNWIS